MKRFIFLLVLLSVKQSIYSIPCTGTAGYHQLGDCEPQHFFPNPFKHNIRNSHDGERKSYIKNWCTTHCPALETSATKNICSSTLGSLATSDCGGLCTVYFMCQGHKLLETLKTFATAQQSFDNALYGTGATLGGWAQCVNENLPSYLGAVVTEIKSAVPAKVRSIIHTQANNAVRNACQKHYSSQGKISKCESKLKNKISSKLPAKITSAINAANTEIDTMESLVLKSHKIGKHNSPIETAKTAALQQIQQIKDEGNKSTSGLSKSAKESIKKAKNKSNILTSIGVGLKKQWPAIRGNCPTIFHNYAKESNSYVTAMINFFNKVNSITVTCTKTSGKGICAPTYESSTSTNVVCKGSHSDTVCQTTNLLTTTPVRSAPQLACISSQKADQVSSNPCRHAKANCALTRNLIDSCSGPNCAVYGATCKVKPGTTGGPCTTAYMCRVRPGSTGGPCTAKYVEGSTVCEGSNCEIDPTQPVCRGKNCTPQGGYCKLKADHFGGPCVATGSHGCIGENCTAINGPCMGKDCISWCGSAIGQDAHGCKGTCVGKDCYAQKAAAGKGGVSGCEDFVWMNSLSNLAAVNAEIMSAQKNLIDTSNKQNTLKLSRFQTPVVGAGAIYNYLSSIATRCNTCMKKFVKTSSGSSAASQIETTVTVMAIGIIAGAAIGGPIGLAVGIGIAVYMLVGLGIEMFCEKVMHVAAGYCKDWNVFADLWNWINSFPAVRKFDAAVAKWVKGAIKSIEKAIDKDANYCCDGECHKAYPRCWGFDI